MISRKEWYAALRRMLKRAALVFGGLFLMAAFFYWRVFDLRLEAALLATLSAVLTRRKMREAAERQRNYWDGDEP